MNKEKKYLNDLSNKLNNISIKDKNKIIKKYEKIIKKEKKNNKKINIILKELGTPTNVSKKEIELLNNKKSSFKNIIEFITKDIQFPKKEKKTKIKKDNIFKKIKNKFKKKETLKEEIINTKEEIQNELPNVVETITEKKILEPKSKRTKRIIFKSLGIILIMILLFIWLWSTVIFISSLFAILDGIKLYGINITLFGINILLLIIVLLVNKLILNKKINSKYTIISILLVIIIIAIGISLSIKEISNINIIKDVSDKYTMTRKYEKISLPSNLDKITRISFNSHYNTKYEIEYDNTLDNKITIETKYYESYYDYYIKRNINDIYVSLSLDYRDRLSVYLENLKDNKIYDKNELSRYTVKITINERDKDRVIIEN